ncbi:PilZ domain-containing protein [Celerinatantimonas sp. YJH-8]|uniref:PilZ domain-containing protein n=1 Tax=Celerinatantimonas sp. YJH-8 TaxID=3228714 RepID=UPI0038CB62BF
MSEEKRHFTRIQFSYQVELAVNDLCVTTQLIDLSLHGALVAKPLNWPDQITAIQLRIPLDDKNPDDVIRIETQRRHYNDDSLGLEFIRMDLDSATFLRRLLELNLGDEQLLQRQFKELIQYNAQ